MNRGKDRKRGLSGEDEQLWAWVARTVAPDTGKPRVLARDASDAEWPPQTTEPSQPSQPPRPPPAARPKSAPSVPVADPPPRKPQPGPKPAEPKPLVLERRKARRIARGAEEIEARLDLHGMTQDDAHHALVGFVRRCHASGMRTVLVITGKGGVGGARRDDDHVIPRPRGVLRRNVPAWLCGPDIGTLVVSYSAAHIRHGGEGAIYVRLRRKD
jgi:DNA-nicking Smr family endonuclease